MMKDTGFKSPRQKRRFRNGVPPGRLSATLVQVSFRTSGSHGLDALYQGTTLESGRKGLEENWVLTPATAHPAANACPEIILDLSVVFSARTQRESPGAKALILRGSTVRLKPCPDTVHEFFGSL